jgi:hypothetical protein
MATSELINFELETSDEPMNKRDLSKRGAKDWN